MPTVQSICRKREHGNPPGPMHTDLAACDAYERELDDDVVRDLLADVQEMTTAIDAARKDIKDWEAKLADLIKEAFQYGVTGTELARVTGLSRARIYQIRDGRR